MRLAHILKKNFMGEKPSWVVFFDTETEELKIDKKRKKLVFKLGWACLWSVQWKTYKWKQYKEKKDFWRWLLSNVPEKSKVYLIAHNVGFDMRVLHAFGYLKKNKWKLTKFYNKGQTTLITFRKRSRTLCFMDNGNFFKGSLKALGESIGIAKLDMKKENLSVYCRRDVEILVEAWKRLVSYIQENNLGNFAPTLAGQAFNAFRHRFYDIPIYIHVHEKAIKAERASYHGGRVECFHIGKVPANKFYNLDINSMYPYVMKNYALPVKLIEVKKTMGIDEAYRRINMRSQGLIAKATVRTENPVFPVVMKTKLVYPVGSFQTYLSTPEISYGLDKGIIFKLEEVNVYKTAIIFDRYVDFFYGQKKKFGEEGQKAFYLFSKLMLNSLYGKFGQKSEEYELVGKTKFTGMEYEFDDETDEKKTYRCLNGQKFLKLGTREGYNAMVAIAAHITANARMYLWRLMNIIGRKNIFYCDTDSLFVNSQGYENAANAGLLGDEIGQFGVRKIARKFTIYGPKDYVFDGDITMKGIKADAKKLGDSHYAQIAFTGLSGAIRRGTVDDVVITRVEKHLKRKYDKGTVLPGGAVKPFVL